MPRVYRFLSKRPAWSVCIRACKASGSSTCPHIPCGTLLEELGSASRPRCQADRSVPIIVYAPGAVKPSVNESSVETTQIAPTILDLLGLDPGALQGVQIEGTETLPGSAPH